MKKRDRQDIYNKIELLSTITDSVNSLNYRIKRKESYIQIDADELEKLTIKLKNGRYQKFFLNGWQKDTLEIINKKLQLGIPIRHIYLKLRQCGSSTFHACVTYYLCKVYGLNAVIIGHKDGSSQNLNVMVQTFYKFDPDFTHKRRITRKSDKGLRFDSGGHIRVHTAGSDDAAVSTTNQIVLATEQALWPRNPGEQMRGLLNTVNDEAGTFVFIESTARGIGNDFHNRWMAASREEEARDVLNGVDTEFDYELYKDDIIYEPIFIGWLTHGECVKEFRNIKHREEFIKTIGAHHERPEDNELEQAYVDLGASPERIHWWRTTLMSKCGGSVADMQQENPATPEEAFLNTGTNMFDHAKINRMYKNAKTPIFVGEVNMTEQLPWQRMMQDEAVRDVGFMRIKTGRLKIWEWPQHHVNYSIGSDVAEGVSVVKNGKEVNDDSTIVVRNRESGLIAATWLGKVSPQELADVIKRIALFYNEAVVCIEANTFGQATNERVYNNYLSSRVYQQRMGMNIARRTRTDRVGYQNSPTSKPYLMSQLAYAFRCGDIEIHDKELLKEMSQTQSDPVTGKIPTKGKDLLIALALQEEAHVWMPKQTWAEKKVDTYAEYKEMIKQWNTEAELQNRLNRMFERAQWQV